MKKLTIIIVTYKSNNIIDNCLDSIYKYNDINEFLEIIIVDNSPFEDEMFDRIKIQYPDVKLIKNVLNGGYGQGNNLGIKYAKSEYILIMNPDVILIESMFIYILNYFDKNDKVAIIGIKQLKEKMKNSFSFFFRIEYENIFSKHILNRIYNSLNIFIKNKMYVSGAFFFIRKDIIESIDGFDESIFMFAEEPDLIRRIENTNTLTRDVVYLARFKFQHLQEVNHLNYNTIYNVIKSGIYYLRKHNFSVNKYLYSERLYYSFKIIFYKIKRNEIEFEKSKQILKLIRQELKN